MNQRKVKLFLLTVLVAVSLFFLLEKNFLPGLSTKTSSNKRFKLLGRVINLIKNDYVVEVNPSKTMEGAFRGLVDSLDPLSSYLDRESALKYRQRKEPKLKDIGIILFKKHGSFPHIIGIKKDSPAEKKEVKIGDIISALDGRSTLTMSMLEANLYLKDREENPIKLKILRGGKTQEVSIETKLLFDEHFSYSKLKGTSGILKINQLYPPCVSKIKEKIIPRLKPQKRTLILDLRNCHEGEIEEACKFINLFLKAEKIGYIKKKGEIKEILSCSQEPELEKLPLLIWINQATIGPAEAVVGVLKEFKKNKIIGLPTQGLVAKQNFFSLKDGSALVLTSGIFYLNSGKKLWGNGVKPDVKIEWEDQSFNSYLKKTLNLLPKI